MINKHLYILDRINQFENQHNLDFLNTKYGNFWPLLRFEIIRFVIYNKHNIKERNIIYRTASELKNGIKYTTTYPYKIMRPSYHNTEIEEIWISSSQRRSENTDNYNKFIDPFYNELATNNSMMIESDNKKKPTYSNKHIKTKEIHNIYPSVIWFNHKHFIKNIMSFELTKKKFNLEYLARYFKPIKPYDLFFSISTFIKWYNYYQYFLSNFPKLRKIVYLAYGSPDLLALNAVCKNHKIATIDLQHGAQMENHFDYDRWIQLNANIRQLLPTGFFVFSDKEKRLLQDTFGKEVDVAVVGNLSFKKWNETKNKTQLKNDILITLQNTIIEEDHFLFSFILYLNKNYPWLNIVFRIHPRHTRLKAEFSKTLNKHNIKYYWSNVTDIYDALATAFINITQFSSTIKDALLLGTTSFIIDPLGKFLFKDEIKYNNNIRVVLDLETAILEFEKMLSDSSR